MIYDLAILVRFQLDLIINIELLFISVGVVSIIYSLFNYNPMYSLLFFILFLFNTIIYLFIENNEFLALLVGLIYFGAILILFFFVILLINLQVVTRDNLHIKKISISGLFILIILNQFLYWTKNLGLYLPTIINVSLGKTLSLETLSITMFNNFSTHIIILGLILFLALIGIVLILVSNTNLQLTYLKGRVSK